jgi:hypothetical protein
MNCGLGKVWNEAAMTFLDDVQDLSKRLGKSEHLSRDCQYPREFWTGHLPNTLAAVAQSV